MSRFDEIIHAIRDEHADAASEARAADRVRERIFGSEPAASGPLRNCPAFQSLIPAFVDGTLPAPRRALFEDHLGGCPACRMALEEARLGPRPKAAAVEPVASSSRRWAIAAAVIAAAGLASLAAWRLVLPDRGMPVATVQSVSGSLYQLEESGATPAPAGHLLYDRALVQSAAGSTAVIRLFDGSFVEMNARARISIERGWRGTTLRLLNGHLIVEAAPQGRGRLAVATADSRVSVKGTIFSVNRGLRGTRVSVVEGEVQVDHGGRSESLTPGGQSVTDPSLEPNGVAGEVNWSRNAARYLALLGELNILQKKIETLRAPSLRHASRLLTLVPSDTVLYAAVPNAGNAVVEAKRILDEQLRSSEVLRQWWLTGSSKAQREIDEIIRHIQQLSPLIGDEVVLVFDQAHDAVILAEARSATLRAQIEEVLRKAQPQRPYQFGIRNNIVVISQTAARFRQFDSIAAAGAAPTFPFRDRIAQAYRAGAGWLVAGNLEQILAASVPSKGRPSPADMGMTNVRYLIVERRELSGRVENSATATFAGARLGVPSWLGAPGPMAALDFVSPDAGAAFAMITRNPRAITEEIFNLARKASPRFDTGLAQVERRLGVRIADDLAAPLGSEAAFAIDGALLPSPNWKLALEVYSPARLQFAIQRIVETANREASKELGQVTLAQENLLGRTFYTLSAEKAPLVIHYVHADGFLVAGATRGLLQQALQLRQSGGSLARSQRFRSLLPTGISPNLSAVFYHNLSGMLSPAVDQLKDLNIVPPAQRQAMLALRDTPPGLIAAHGEPDRITASTLGSFLGLNLGMLAGLDQLPNLLLAPGALRP